MKKLSFILVPALALSIVSCNKKDDTTTPTTPVATTPAPPSPHVTDVNGALIGVQIKFTTIQAGISVDLNTETGLAAFYSSPWSPTGTNTMVDAGTVKVNTNALTKGTDNTYTKTATAGQTPADLSFSSGIGWDVAGSGSITAFTYTTTKNFPDFTGTIPSTITKASGVSFTFNTTNNADADSVIVVIISGSNSFTKSYSKNAGTITISAADMSALGATTTGYIEVCPYNVELKSINSKEYAFVKETARLQMLTIN